jgi:hypothetical protein
LRTQAAQPPTVTIGRNFTGNTYGSSVASIPADANGAIGPRHFVEFINGSFVVYNKTNGVSTKRISDTKFWSNAGVVLSPSDVTTDPRIVYDPLSQRWFASMVDADGFATDPALESNDFLLAVSATSDPTGTWHGYLFQSDPDTGYFADFPTLGMDSNAVYLSGDFYYGSDTPIGPGLVSFPKSDLLLATPNFENRTWLGVMDYDIRGQVLQPVICPDGSVSGKIIATSDVGNDSDPHSNIVVSVVLNGGTATASLSAPAIIPTLPWHVPDNDDFGAPLLTVSQPDGSTTLMANEARFSAKVYGVGGVIYAVHSTEFNGRVAIRWYRIRASDNAMLETGTLSDPSMDLFFPSIAANAYGVVAICYNGAGLGTYVTSFAQVGQTSAGVTTFGSRNVLKACSTSYHGDDELLLELEDLPPFSRWGDYSATSVDPVDPTHFWTIQMVPGDSPDGDVWTTQITEVITPNPLVLNLTSTSGNVTVSWPNIAGFKLESSTNLAPPVVWSNVAQTPGTNGAGLLNVTLPLSGARQFFRLEHQ